MTNDMQARNSEQEALFKQAGEAFAAFCRTIAALRDPVKGCPWDLEQDHMSLRRYMLEEAYEAFHALSSGDATDICEELGDVLLQVVLNAQVAHDEGRFCVSQVIAGIDEKMQRRHPHVFQEGVTADSAATVKGQWEKIKQQEKQRRSSGDAALESPFASLATLLPATTQASEIGKKARKINFDWEKPEQVMKQFLAEVIELELACKESKWLPAAHVEEELGDVYFTLAQLCRHFSLDSETVALDGNRKFLKRFTAVCQLAQKQGLDVTKLSQQQLEQLWGEAKKAARNKPSS